MSVAAKAPLGGISAQIGTRTFPLILRNGEIERFEEQHDVGIFAVLDALISGNSQARHVRDIVALGLIGGGMRDAAADKMVSELEPHHNIALRAVARDLVMTAFVDPSALKKNVEDGLADPNEPIANSTQSEKSETQ